MSDKREDRLKKDEAIAGTLYVVFHGEFALFDSGEPDEDIQAFAPDMDVHQYLAGPWMGENHIPPGLLLGLTGVIPGGFKLGDDDELTVRFGGARQTDAPRYLQIDLPRPDKVFSGGRMTIDSDEIDTSSGIKTTIPCDCSVALCQVFQYRTTQSAKPPRFYVKSGDMMAGYEPNWVAGQPDEQAGYYVLHAFAEADCIAGAEHVKMAANASAALLGLPPVFGAPGPGSKYSSARCVPCGLIDDELNLTLAMRALVTGGLGRQHQRDPGTPLIWGECVDGDPGRKMTGHDLNVRFGGRASCGLINGVKGT